MVSTRLAKLAREHPLALGLYWVLKAEADDFGRFTADPEKFAVKCGGLAHLTAEEATEIMQAMKVCGVIRFYKVDGERYLEIVEYMKHEHDGEPKWNYVGRAEFPPPPDWTPPASLVAFIRANITKRNVTPARYGIEPGINAACDKILTALGAQEPEPQSNPSPAPVEPQSNCTSTTVQPQLNEVSIDVDVDSDVDCEGDNDRAREAPAEKTDDLTTRQAVASEFQRLWPTGIPDDVRDPIMRETVATDPQIAVMAARKTASKFEHQTIDRWKIRDYFISTAQGMTLDARGKQQHDGVTPSAEGNPEPYVFAWLDRTPEEQERIDAQAQAMWEQDRAEWAAAKAASGGGGA
jgi:hypothetical protein